jgi:hypothetical protein
VCQAGLFYEQFYTPTGKKETDEPIRLDTKQQLYKAIFFDFKPWKAIAKQFADLFPHTYQSLAQIALENEILEETLASKLQNTEAEIFNDLEPIHSKYYFTLFDAIYFTNINDIAPLMHQIEEKFHSLGLIVPLSINEYGEDENCEVDQ